MSITSTHFQPTNPWASDPRPLFRWLIDTRQLWRDDFETQVTPFHQTFIPFIALLQLTPPPLLSPQSHPFLSLLKPTERQSVLRYYHVRDKAMSLASHLLKYHAISHIYSLPWSSITLSRAPNHKPCYVPLRAGDAALEFNVSHQAGLVVLIAATSPSGSAEDSKPIKEVGIDIVCVHERDETPGIDNNGFDGWVDTYQDVFSPRELDDMKYHLPSLALPSGEIVSANALRGIAHYCKRNVTLPLTLESGQEITIDSNLIIEAKLRRFYTFWALKEAYVKLTGEALLADWLRDLEFRGVRAPRAAAATAGTEKNDGDEVWGEVVRDVQVWRGNQRLTNVTMEICAFERDYIIASAMIRTDDDDDDDEQQQQEEEEKEEIWPAFAMLDVERDILPSAVAER